jgi:hypothetical protein
MLTHTGNSRGTITRRQWWTISSRSYHWLVTVENELLKPSLLWRCTGTSPWQSGNADIEFYRIKWSFDNQDDICLSKLSCKCLSDLGSSSRFVLLFWKLCSPLSLPANTSDTSTDFIRRGYLYKNSIECQKMDRDTPFHWFCRVDTYIDNVVSLSRCRS